MATKKEQTHQKILKSMHKTFREHGYNGAGVNGLANEAGVTSGAFYAHFGSKSGAFKEVITEGVSQFDQGLKQYQEKYGETWLEEFIAFYLGEKRRTELNDSCALQSLTPEVVRSDDETKTLFQQELLKAAATMSEQKPNTESTQIDTETWAKLAMIIGGVTLARAVQDPNLADEIANSVQAAMKAK
ncbi:TetR/AcrR family transcriptional regulator [Marinomonas sp. PE14-40]|uniref:TetR/AcrR family transcriptional regulator n=1 Tax=Marinomonas sp. PE14-40 TaxID=3060621 RepID=UPI003F67F8F4